MSPAEDFLSTPHIGPLKYPMGFQLEGLHPAGAGAHLPRTCASAFLLPLKDCPSQGLRGRCSEGSNQGKKTQCKLLSINDTQTFQLPSGFVFNLCEQEDQNRVSQQLLACARLCHQMGRNIEQDRKCFGFRKCLVVSEATNLG